MRKLSSRKQSEKFKASLLKWLEKKGNRRAKAARFCGVTPQRLSTFLDPNDKSKINVQAIINFCKATRRDPKVILGYDPENRTQEVGGIKKAISAYCTAKMPSSRRTHAHNIANCLQEMAWQECAVRSTCSVILDVEGLPNFIQLSLAPRVDLPTSFWPAFRIPLVEPEQMQKGKLLFEFFMVPDRVSTVGTLTVVNIRTTIRQLYYGKPKK